MLLNKILNDSKHMAGKKVPLLCRIFSLLVLLLESFDLLCYMINVRFIWMAEMQNISIAIFVYLMLIYSTFVFVFIPLPKYKYYSTNNKG